MVTRCTHSCSLAAWRCRNNPACSSGKRHPRCDKDSADIRQFGCHRTPGPTCRCCYCTDRADMSHPLPRGFHGNQVSTHHSEHLQEETAIQTSDESSTVYRSFTKTFITWVSVIRNINFQHPHITDILTTFTLQLLSPKHKLVLEQWLLFLLTFSLL